MALQGVTPHGMATEEIAQFLQQEMARYAKIGMDSGAMLD